MSSDSFVKVPSQYTGWDPESIFNNKRNILRSDDSTDTPNNRVPVEVAAKNSYTKRPHSNTSIKIEDSDIDLSEVGIIPFKAESKVDIGARKSVHMTAHRQTMSAAKDGVDGDEDDVVDITGVGAAHFEREVKHPYGSVYTGDPEGDERLYMDIDNVTVVKSADAVEVETVENNKGKDKDKDRLEEKENEKDVDEIQNGSLSDFAANTINDNFIIPLQSGNDDNVDDVNVNTKQGNIDSENMEQKTDDGIRNYDNVDDVISHTEGEGGGVVVDMREKVEQENNEKILITTTTTPKEGALLLPDDAELNQVSRDTSGENNNMNNSNDENNEDNGGEDEISLSSEHESDVIAMDIGKGKVDTDDGNDDKGLLLLSEQKDSLDCLPIPIQEVNTGTIPVGSDPNMGDGSSWMRGNAAVQIQKMARGFLGRRAYAKLLLQLERDKLRTKEQVIEKRQQHQQQQKQQQEEQVRATDPSMSPSSVTETITSDVDNVLPEGINCKDGTDKRDESYPGGFDTDQGELAIHRTRSLSGRLQKQRSAILAASESLLVSIPGPVGALDYGGTIRSTESRESGTSSRPTSPEGSEYSPRLVVSRRKSSAHMIEAALIESEGEDDNDDEAFAEDHVSNMMVYNAETIEEETTEDINDEMRNTMDIANIPATATDTETDRESEDGIDKVGQGEGQGQGDDVYEDSIDMTSNLNPDPISPQQQLLQQQQQQHSSVAVPEMNNKPANRKDPLSDNRMESRVTIDTDQETVEEDNSSVVSVRVRQGPGPGGQRRVSNATHARRHNAVTCIQRMFRGLLGRRRAQQRREKLKQVAAYTCKNCGRMERGGVYCKGCGRRKNPPPPKQQPLRGESSVTSDGSSSNMEGDQRDGVGGRGGRSSRASGLPVSVSAVRQGLGAAVSDGNSRQRQLEQKKVTVDKPMKSVSRIVETPVVSSPARGRKSPSGRKDYGSPRKPQQGEHSSAFSPSKQAVPLYRAAKDDKKIIKPAVGNALPLSSPLSLPLSLAPHGSPLPSFKTKTPTLAVAKSTAVAMTPPRNRPSHSHRVIDGTTDNSIIKTPIRPSRNEDKPTAMSRQQQQQPESRSRVELRPKPSLNPNPDAQLLPSPSRPHRQASKPVKKHTSPPRDWRSLATEAAEEEDGRGKGGKGGEGSSSSVTSSEPAVHRDRLLSVRPADKGNNGSMVPKESQSQLSKKSSRQREVKRETPTPAPAPDRIPNKESREDIVKSNNKVEPAPAPAPVDILNQWTSALQAEQGQGGGGGGGNGGGQGGGSYLQEYKRRAGVRSIPKKGTATTTTTTTTTTPGTLPALPQALLPPQMDTLLSPRYNHHHDDRANVDSQSKGHRHVSRRSTTSAPTKLPAEKSSSVPVLPAPVRKSHDYYNAPTDLLENNRNRRR
eukprot:gene3999-7969_t